MAMPAETVDVSEQPASPRAQRLVARRAELLDAAIRVIRREGDRVAMEGIAAEAGISRPILYRHFGDACGLYTAVARRFSDELGARLLRSAGEVSSGRALLHRQVQTFLGFVADDPELYRFLVRRAPAPMRQQQRNGFSLLVSKGTAAFLEAAGWDRAAAIVASDLLVGGLEATADRWLDQPVGTHEEVAELVTTVVWSGFSALARAAAPAPAPAPAPAEAAPST
jgi:AcrR family transcriptional regulator